MRRYLSNDQTPSSVLYAWQLLGNSVYRDNPHGSETLILSRPRLTNQQNVAFLYYLLY